MCHICGNINLEEKFDCGGITIEEFEPIYVLAKQIMKGEQCENKI